MERGARPPLLKKTMPGSSQRGKKERDIKALDKFSWRERWGRDKVVSEKKTTNPNW